MPNFAFMLVQWVYLLALMVWVGGMITFVVLFVPSLTTTLDRPTAGRVISAFLGYYRSAVTVAIALLTGTSVAKFLLWERNLTPWLTARWGCLAIMVVLVLYDFGTLAPRLAAAKAAGDQAAFARTHRTAASTMLLTLAFGLVALFLS
ncbi:MAG: DUF4149 domain-containing protein [Nitrospirota bacterium]|nr:DUF4149 domain-containing protein [Nitrospirota bacterium]